MSVAEIVAYLAWAFLAMSLIVALAVLGAFLHRSITQPAPGADEALAWRPGVES